MAIYTCGFEGGTLAATIGTDGGDASTPFNSVSSGFLYDNAHTFKGSRAAKLPSTATSTQRIEWANGTSKGFGRCYVWVSNQATSDTWVAHMPNTGGNGLRVLINSAGKLRLQSNAGANLATDTAVFPTGQWVRLELFADAGTSTTTGQIRVAYYVGNSTTAAWDSTLLTGVDAAGATGAFSAMRFAQSTASAGDVWYDEVGLKTSTDAVWGTWLAANALPSLTLTGVQNVAASTSVTVTASASDTDGSIASYAWTLVSPSTGAPTLTGASTASVSFTTGTAGNMYTLQCVVTDNDGGTNTQTTEVRVPVATGTSLRHLAVDGTGAGTWTKTGGSATDGAALNDEVDTTYIESAVLTSTPTTRKVRLAPSPSRTGYVLKERLWLDSSGSPTVKVRLIEGVSTVRQEWTQAVTTTPTEYSFTVSSPGAIADPGFLSVEVEGAL